MMKVKPVKIIILLVLVYLICFHMPAQEEQNNNQIETNETENNIENNTENEITESNQIEENETTTNTSNQSPEVTSNNNGSQLQANEPQGVEEQQSSIENQGINEEEKAIEMAKQAWGLSTDSYTFSIDSKEGDIYHVQVISNAMVIANYDVNVKTGEVIEK